MYSWSDHPLQAGKPNRAVYIQELRKALDEKRKGMGLTPADWSEPIKIGEPKKYSHTQQLMLACDDTAKKYGFDSYQDILTREWTPIEQGGPYRHQIVNDLRQVIDGLVWIGFEERFPGNKLDLEKWTIIQQDFPWYVNERLFFRKEFRTSRTEGYWKTQINLKTGIIAKYPVGFAIEYNAYVDNRFEYGYYYSYSQMLMCLFLPWGRITLICKNEKGYWEDYYKIYSISGNFNWSPKNSLNFNRGWRQELGTIFPSPHIKLVVTDKKQSFFVNKELWAESVGSVDVKEGGLSISGEGGITMLWGTHDRIWVGDAWIDNILVHPPEIKE